MSKVAQRGGSGAGRSSRCLSCCHPATPSQPPKAPQSPPPSSPALWAVFLLCSVPRAERSPLISCLRLHLLRAPPTTDSSHPGLLEAPPTCRACSQLSTCASTVPYAGNAVPCIASSFKSLLRSPLPSEAGGRPVLHCPASASHSASTVTLPPARSLCHLPHYKAGPVRAGIFVFLAWGSRALRTVPGAQWAHNRHVSSE